MSVFCYPENLNDKFISSFSQEKSFGMKLKKDLKNFFHLIHEKKFNHFD